MLSKIINRTLTLALVSLIFVSCKPLGQNNSEIKFTANKEIGNFMILVEGDHSGGIGPSVRQDPQHIKNVVDKAGLNFPEANRVHLPNEPTASELSRAITDLARRSLEADQQFRTEHPKDLSTPLSTLFIYMSSHGAPGGYTSVGQGGMFHSSDVIKAVAAGRKLSDGTSWPVQRLVIMWDTCHAASNIAGISNNANSVVTAGGSDTGIGDLGSLFSGIALTSTSSDQITGNSARAAYANIAKAYTATEPIDKNYLDNKIETSMSELQSLERDKVYKSLVLIMSSRATELSSSEYNGGTATLAFGNAVTSSLNGVGLNGGLNPLGDALNGVDSTQPTNYVEAPTGPKSPKTIEEVLSLMVKNGIAGGQTPVWCVEPAEVAKDYFFQRPDNALPVEIPPIGKNPTASRFCSDNSNLTGGL